MYLDPGFGSMIIQIVIAAFAALGGTFLIIKKDIKRWFARKKGVQEEVSDEELLQDADGDLSLMKANTQPESPADQTEATK